MREVGSCFQFSADQRFKYSLSSGAYDESWEGHWRLEGNEVVLESPLYDRKPRFVFRQRRAAETFKVIVVNAGGRGLAGIDVRIGCGTSVHEGHTQQDGYTTSCVNAPGQIALGIRMVGLSYQVVPVIGTGAEKGFVFEFEPGDLGKKSFAAARLTRDSGGLRMIYRNATVRDLDGTPFTYRAN